MQQTPLEGPQRFNTPTLIFKDLLLDDVRWYDHLNALDQLLDLEYWNRIWIIQDVYLAKHKVVHIGKVEFEWSLFDDCLSYIEE